jgi:hypothetical protein
VASTDVVTGAVATAPGTNVGQVSGVSIATCADGEHLLGGGALTTSTGNAVPAVLFSMPAPNDGSTPTRWQAEAVAVTGAAAGNVISVTAYAICG